MYEKACKTFHRGQVTEEDVAGPQPHATSKVSSPVNAAQEGG
jgi:hypothetical protein